MLSATNRHCSAITEGGSPCGATPMTESRFCFWHDPETQQQAAEARRLGGQRRRRESTVAGAYEFEGFGSIAEIRRFLEIAAFEALALDNSIARVRAMTGLAQAAASLLEKGEIEDRLTALESTLAPRMPVKRRP